ncbi:MAG TPA: hypothetical protein VF524_04965, partial [Polyangia bacterium]
HRRRPTPRDFLPWRFSDAGSPSVGMASACRHPKTCTGTDSCAMVSRHLARSLIGLVRIVDDTIDDEVLPFRMAQLPHALHKCAIDALIA